MMSQKIATQNEYGPDSLCSTVKCPGQNNLNKECLFGFYLECTVYLMTNAKELNMNLLG